MKLFKRFPSCERLIIGYYLDGARTMQIRSFDASRHSAQKQRKPFLSNAVSPASSHERVNTSRGEIEILSKLIRIDKKSRSMAD
jgi:hypothetical protein